MLVAEGLPGTWCEARAGRPAGSAYDLVNNVVQDNERYKVWVQGLGYRI